MKTTTTLSRHKPGTLLELLAISLPLILVSFSDNMMIFIDRIMVSHISLTSLNSITLASQAIEVLQYGIVGLTGVVEIFVARLYIKKKFDTLSKPTWQMLLLSLMSFPLMILLSLVTSQWVLHGKYLELGVTYYQIMLFTIPLIGIIASLSGFFVGTAQLKIILYSTVVINLLHILLAYYLIFGIPNIIPTLGVTGAAIATIIPFFIQALWLLFIFLHKKNRLKYNTSQYSFNKKYFFYQLKIAYPIAIGYMGDMLGLFILVKIIAKTTVINLTFFSIGSTLFIFFNFIIDGLYRALSTIISQHLSLENRKLIQRSKRAATLFIVIVLLLIAIPIIWAPHSILALFNLKNISTIHFNDLRYSLFFLWVFFLLTGIFWLYAAILTAQHDTKFIMLISVLGMWIFAVAPIYVIANNNQLTPTLIWPMLNIYIIASCISIIWRYYYKVAKNRSAHGKQRH